jgi:hypothetical protein
MSAVTPLKLGTDGKAAQFTTGDTYNLTFFSANSIPSSKLVGTDITTLGTVISGGLGTGAVLGGVTMTLGSDATGDIYYRNSGGVLTRLGIGSTNQVLTVIGGLPSWQPSGSAPVTSVFGRTGAVVAAANDYTFAQLASKPTTIGGYGITDTTAQLLTGYVSGAGVVAATDSILQGIQKLNGNIAALITGVSSVTNADGTITISPTTGAVVASLALGHANTWTAAQTFGLITTINSINLGLQTVATAGATTTLTNTSPFVTVFTGTLGQTFILPNATTLAVGQQYSVINNSTGSITAQTNGGGSLWTIGPNVNVISFTLLTNGTAAGTWEINYGGALIATGKVFNVSNNLTLAGVDGSVLTFGGNFTTSGAFASTFTMVGTTTVTFPTSGTLLTTTGSGASLTGIPLTVSNADGTLTVTPTTGAVVASLALGHANTWTGPQTFNAGQLICGPSTATNPSLKFTPAAAVLMTTAVAGDAEVDTNGVLYYSQAASSRGVVNAEQFISLTAAYTLTSQTAAQKLFNASTNGQITATASTTYEFECEFSLTGVSATSNAGFGFAIGGTATLTSQGWSALAVKGTLATATAPALTYNTAANTSLCVATTGVNGIAKIRGFIRVNAAGTIIPQVSLITAAAAIVGVNSFFRMWPVGSNTVTTVGNWS